MTQVTNPSPPPMQTRSAVPVRAKWAHVSKLVWPVAALAVILLYNLFFTPGFFHIEVRDGRLFDVFRGPHFTLLGFGAEHAATVARVNERYGPKVRAYTVGAAGDRTDLVDEGGHARRAYGTGGLVLVRPDGYIGVYDAPVEDYLRAFA